MIPVGALIAAAVSIIDKVIPDPAAAAEAKLKVLTLHQTGELAALESDTKLALGQLEVNKVEAGGGFFRSGWRPAVGWICASGLGYQVFVRPIASWFAMNLYGWQPMPSLEMETLMTLLFGLLGLGAYRTVERIKAKEA